MRHRTYPRVKAYGGLYKVRRQPRDDSLVCEIKLAMSNIPPPSHVSTGAITRVGSLKEQKRKDSNITASLAA